MSKKKRKKKKKKKAVVASLENGLEDETPSGVGGDTSETNQNGQDNSGIFGKALKYITTNPLAAFPLQKYLIDTYMYLTEIGCSLRVLVVTGPTSNEERIK